MKNIDKSNFSLANFEGPLDFLWHLIQKNEIDIHDISIRLITAQFIQKFHDLDKDDINDIDEGAEFIATAASLVWLKSKMLLPAHEQVNSLDEEENDPRFEIIHHLLDYCRFKQAAKELAHREIQQSAFYLRGTEVLGDNKKNLGIEHLTLQDLASLFQIVAAKATVKKGVVSEEEWKVSDKIKEVRMLLKECTQIVFEELFTPDRSKDELIATFLAILELMKLGEIIVVREQTTQQVLIIAR